MTLKDLRTLEIGLELYRRTGPLDGHCDELIEILQQVVRHDIGKLEDEKMARKIRRKSREILRTGLSPAE